MLRQRKQKSNRAAGASAQRIPLSVTVACGHACWWGQPTVLDAQQRCKMRGDCRVTGVHWCRAQDTGVRGAMDRPSGLRWDGPGESRARTANTRGDGPRISAFDCSAGGERARARRLDRGDGRRTAKRFDDTCARTSAKDDRRSARMERAARACWRMCAALVRTHRD